MLYTAGKHGRIVYFFMSTLVFRYNGEEICLIRHNIAVHILAVPDCRMFSRDNVFFCSNGPDQATIRVVDVNIDLGWSGQAIKNGHFVSMAGVERDCGRPHI